MTEGGEEKTEHAQWRPSATLEVLKARSRLNASVRAFFNARAVCEVETPILSAGATVDRHIESFCTRDGRWLQTSPEFAMKRLLAAGSGPIFQITRVFRLEEQGRHHNPEFTMLEWYRPGFSMHALMDEVEALMQALDARPAAFERLTYRQAFQRHAGFDPFLIPVEELRSAALAQDLISAADFIDEDRDFWLDLWMSRRVSAALRAPSFVYDFPPSQAALARIRAGSPDVAERFELFWQGIELANGFHELADAQEQRRRFVADQAWRAAAGRSVPPFDRQLIDALSAGLPDCSGVALGLDRVLMLQLGLPQIADVLAFPADRA